MANPNKIKNGGKGTFLGRLLRGQAGGSFGIPKAAPTTAPVVQKPLPPLGGGAPKKKVSVVTSGGAKKIVSNIQNTVNNANNAPVGSLADFDRNRSEYESSLSDIESGNLSPSERKMLRTARSIMGEEIAAQKLANKNFEAGTTQMGIRSGRQRYAPEIQSGYQKAAVDQGIAKVHDLNIQMESKIAEMEQDLKEGKLKEAREKYNEYNDYIKERRALVKSIATGASQGKAAKTAESLKAFDDYKTKGGNLNYSDWAITANAADAATSSPTTITAEYAEQYGLPEAIIGTSTADIVNSLASSEVPEWFTQAYAENAIGYTTIPGNEEAALQQAWNQFRQDPHVLASMPQGGGNEAVVETGSGTSSGSSYTNLPSI